MLEKEILKVEQDFVEMVKKDNIKEAFLYYAADDAVLLRNNSLIKGKDSIKVYSENQTLKYGKLEWTPDFIKVASSGDLAYTYWQYVFSAIDINGEHINAKGVFHTIWRKQSDGIWKFVWD